MEFFKGLWVKNGNAVVIAVRNIERITADRDGVRMTAAVSSKTLFNLADLWACLYDFLQSRQSGWRQRRVDVNRRRFRNVGTAQSGNRVRSILADVTDAYSLRISQRCGQVARVDFLDLDCFRFLCFIGVSGAGISEGVVHIRIPGWCGGLQMSELKHSHVCDEELARIT